MPETVSAKDFERLEAKFDRMAEAVENLVLIEERQTKQNERLGILEVRQQSIEDEFRGLQRRVDRWVNMMFGAFGVLTLAWEIFRIAIK